MIPPLPALFRNPIAISCAATAALVLAALTWWPAGSRTPPVGSDARPIEPRPIPSGLDLERPLFQDPANTDSAAPPPDAPVLVGIAGRLPHDAIAMIRQDDGTTKILAIGQNYRGWRLDSLSGDAALFTRGAQRVRVALPANAAEPADEDLSTIDQ